jgi:hypothetical protein
MFGTFGVLEVALMAAVAALLVRIGTIRWPPRLAAAPAARVAGDSRYIDRLRAMVGGARSAGGWDKE